MEFKSENILGFKISKKPEVDNWRSYDYFQRDNRISIKQSRLYINKTTDTHSGKAEFIAIKKKM